MLKNTKVSFSHVTVSDIVNVTEASEFIVKGCLHVTKHACTINVVSNGSPKQFWGEISTEPNNDIIYMKSQASNINFLFFGFSYFCHFPK